MGTAPTTDNTPAEVLDTVIKDAETIGNTAAESVAITYLPFLGWPVVRQLFEAALGWISGSLAKALELQGTFWIIEFETPVEMNAAQAQLKKLQKDAQSKLSAGTISADEAAWLKAVSNFLHSDGSATPQ